MLCFHILLILALPKHSSAGIKTLKTHKSNLSKHSTLFLAQTTKSCNHGEITQVSSDVSCRSFYLCSHGHQMLMTCAPGTMFDSKCLCCNHLTMVSCSTAAASIMKGK